MTQTRATMRVGCIECDDRPESYFIVTGYHRGMIRAFDSDQHAAFETEREYHRGHAGAWAIREIVP